MFYYPVDKILEAINKQTYIRSAVRTVKAAKCCGQSINLGIYIPIDLDFNITLQSLSNTTDSELYYNADSQLFIF